MLIADYVTTSPSTVLGSGGGGKDEGGTGGGRIYITTTHLKVDNAFLYADGSVSDVPGIGSGSGGSITVIASSSFISTSTGREVPLTISANGGHGILEESGPGGGGRIFLVNSCCYILFH